MTSEVRVLEIEGERGVQFSAGPDPRRVWATILGGVSSIQNVYLVGVSRWTAWRLRAGGDSRSPVRVVGQMVRLGPSSLDRLRWLSHEGGHLSVFYQTTDEALVRALAAQGRTAEIKDLSTLVGTGLRTLDARARLLEKIAQESIVFGFGHDGWPMYVLARAEVLTRIRAAISSDLAGSFAADQGKPTQGLP